MRQLEKGMYARSLAGHDKGRLYIVLEVRDQELVLTDGRTRTIGHPKTKKRIHVQPDFSIDPTLAEKILGQQVLDDADIQKAIMLKENKEENTCLKQM